jgi:hypothetical protein
MPTEQQKDFDPVSPDQQLFFFELDVRNPIGFLLNSCNS